MAVIVLVIAGITGALGVFTGYAALRVFLESYDIRRPPRQKIGRLRGRFATIIARVVVIETVRAPLSGAECTFARTTVIQMMPTRTRAFAYPEVIAELVDGAAFGLDDGTGVIGAAPGAFTATLDAERTELAVLPPTLQLALITRGHRVPDIGPFVAHERKLRGGERVYAHVHRYEGLDQWLVAEISTKPLPMRHPSPLSGGFLAVSAATLFTITVLLVSSALR